MKSAPRLSLLPDDEVYEIAFAGRSNAGKSTLINTLCQRSDLTKTSSTPGKTREINLFTVETTQPPAVRLIDLPGYGYAKVGKYMKRIWQKELSEYLLRRENLKILVLIMDSRHPLTDLDQTLMDMIGKRSLRQILVFNKADKLNQSEKYHVGKLMQEVVYHWPNCTAVLHSSTKKTGTKELESLICTSVQQSYLQDQLYNSGGS